MASTSGPVLGIDLGTTNSVVAVADGTEVRVLSDSNGSHLVPSVVSFHPNGSILVGHAARERRLIDAANTIYSTKRLIGRQFLSPEVQRSRQRLAFTLQAGKTGGAEVKTRSGTYALAEISAMVLRHLRSLAEETLGESCERAVVTVPANFNELQRSATAAAGKVAGLEVLRIINEPTAATLAYGYGREQGGSVLVYDLGGGTFDVTILDIDKDALEVVSTAGDTFLGGDDIDVALAERFGEFCLRQHRFDVVGEAQAFERVRAAAEWAKCRLSAANECSATLEELFFVDGAPRDITFDLTRAELDTLARPLVARSFDVVNEALRACGRRPKEIDHVVLVGGSTRMPLVQQMVGDFFGRVPRFERDPDLVVAQGAAIQGWMLAGRAVSKPKTQLARVALVRKKTLVGGELSPVEPRPRGPAFAPEARTGRALDDKPARVIEEHAIRDDLPVRGTPALRVPEPGDAAEPAVVAVAGRAVVVEGAAPAASRDPRRSPPPPPARPADPMGLPAPSSAVGSGLPLPHMGAPGEPRTPGAPAHARTEFALSEGDFPRLSHASAPGKALAFDERGNLGAAAPPGAVTGPGAVSQPVIPMSAARGPILMDVTPLALGIETVSGYCQHLISRNAPVPTEKTRRFATGTDNQSAVEIRICQGDSNTFAENQVLGSVVLDALAQKRRGEAQIEVTFLIDANGILDVRAIEVETKREQRTRIALRGGLDTAEIDAMRLRQEAELAIAGQR